jgi:hypothetical protein
MTLLLPYDPGVLPTRPAPTRGERLNLDLPGLPPVKDLRQSIRNRTHPLHSRFVELRRAASEGMAGRAWTFHPVEIQLVIRSPEPLGADIRNTYLGGIMDTLDGSSGYTFTFLPIVYEDDHQVTAVTTSWERSNVENYSLAIVFK